MSLAPIRRAIVQVSAELLRDGLGPLFDSGLAVVGSIALHEMLGPTVGLVIEGDGLPEECAAAGPLKVVKVQFSQEAYGQQRMVRVSGIVLTDRTEADVNVQAYAVRRLRLQAGDTIVVKAQGAIPDFVAERITAAVTEALSPELRGGVRVLVMSQGYDLEILGSGD